jgi:hypothetical protein
VFTLFAGCALGDLLEGPLSKLRAQNVPTVSNDLQSLNLCFLFVTVASAFFLPPALLWLSGVSAHVDFSPLRFMCSQYDDLAPVRLFNASCSLLLYPYETKSRQKENTEEKKDLPFYISVSARTFQFFFSYCLHISNAHTIRLLLSCFLP